MAENRYEEFRLRVGDAVIGLRALGPEYVASMEAYFQQPSDAAQPDVTLTLKVSDHSDRPQIPASLYSVKEIGNGGFSIGDEFVVGYGLDYDGEYRNLPMIGVLSEEYIRH